ncbi:MAG: hypothetical protein V3R45_02225 [Candidatus Aminicenantaceae bacterium]
MSGDFKELLETSIELELLVSDLYSLYNEIFPEDSDFWWDLSFEEKNHASLLESMRTCLLGKSGNTSTNHPVSLSIEIP